MVNPKCAQCKPKYCSQGITDKTPLPSFCPHKNFKNLFEKVARKYQSEEIKHLYVASALTEKECYDERTYREAGLVVPRWPRIREISEFAKKIGARKIDIAFCNGLSEEAARVSQILEKHGLEVSSVVCSCGSIDKQELGVPAEYKIREKEKFEAGCSPLHQAEVLNRAKTDINVIVGLCVGHDMLFTKYSNAPVTTLIVKDRLTGHNPLASLYSKYHRNIV